MSAFTGDSADIKEPQFEWQNSKARRRWRPPTDVYETAEHIVIKVEIAGMKTEDFSITYDDRRLIISGCRRDRSEKTIYQNMEIPYGEFHTEVKVNWPLEQSDIEALYEEGFLFVKLPKRSREYKVPIK